MKRQILHVNNPYQGPGGEAAAKSRTMELPLAGEKEWLREGRLTFMVGALALVLASVVHVLLPQC